VTDARQHKAADRARRRAERRAAGTTAQTEDDVRSGGVDPGTVTRVAAGAAAVGAALGAARSADGTQGRSAGRPPPSAEELHDISVHAREILQQLRGVEPESVSSLRRTESGWRVGLEVVELRRIPESTDVLASYEVELDADGGLIRFERGRRYHRSQADTSGR
jgi:hypothetical protein